MAKPLQRQHTQHLQWNNPPLWSGAIMAALLAGALSAGATAAVPVEESRPTTSRDAPSAQRLPERDSERGAIDARGMAPPQSTAMSDSAAQGADADSGRLTRLFYQLQVLQQEVQELRGLVEEQSYRLDRLARDQQEQYLDLDRRMQALRGSGGQGGGERPLVLPEQGGQGATSRPSPSGASAGSGNEREAYTAAFELMRQRQFEASADAFEALVEEYPNGVYTANAYYWLGELYLALDDNEAARQWFAQVMNLYPDHQKVPDTLYKLGVAYHRLGDVARAREYLNRVRDQHPQSSAAGLAQTYLAEL